MKHHHICKFITNTLHAMYQKVAPCCHQVNAAEKGIQIDKHHIITSLSSTDSHFPKHQWDDLLPQADSPLICSNWWELTPKYWHIGKHNYNATPLVFTRWCLDDPAEHQSWALHGIKGFYIGPAPDIFVVTSVIFQPQGILIFPTQLFFIHQTHTNEWHHLPQKKHLWRQSNNFGLH